MNHKARAENALRRTLTPHYHNSDLFELLAIEFERQLRRVERDAHRIAIRSAANTVGNHVEGGHRHPAFNAVLALEKVR